MFFNRTNQTKQHERSKGSQGKRRFTSPISPAKTNLVTRRIFLEEIPPVNINTKKFGFNGSFTLMVYLHSHICIFRFQSQSCTWQLG